MSGGDVTSRASHTNAGREGLEPPTTGFGDRFSPFPDLGVCPKVARDLGIYLPNASYASP